MKPRFWIVLGFLGAILVGMILFMLPVSSPSHTWMNPMDALFTACSSVCITGLSVIDVGTDLSFFGHVVLLVLVQLGCVGIMTVATFFLVVVGSRLSLSGEFSIANAYGVKGVKSWRGLVLWVVLSMIAIELIGMQILHLAAPDQSLFRCYFYSVMSFCNAGFSLDPGSLAVFQGKPLVLLSMASLVTLGGLGFLVIYNLCTIQFWRRNLVKRGRLSLHSKVVLLSSFVFLVLTYGVMLLSEWNASLEPYSIAEKFSVAFFQSVTPRTCGFTVVPVEKLTPLSRFVSSVMMFIGAAPGGAGGGIKVTTITVFFVTLLGIYRGRRDVSLFKRSLPDLVMRQSIVIVSVYAMLIIFGMAVLLVTDGTGENAPSFENLLFETVSAVSTTGLSTGNTTTSLSQIGRIVIMICMLCGRLGALAVVFLIGGEEERRLIRYPKEELVVG